MTKKEKYAFTMSFPKGRPYTRKYPKEEIKNEDRSVTYIMENGTEYVVQASDRLKMACIWFDSSYGFEEDMSSYQKMSIVKIDIKFASEFWDVPSDDLWLHYNSNYAW